MTNSNRLSEAPLSGSASRQDETFSTLSSYLPNGALFLDIDGTLLDLAPTPDEIIVPPSLPAQLDALSRRLGGALALVTGRGLSYADRLFAPFQFPTAGLHGAERRSPDGSISRVEPTGEFENDPNVTDKKFPGNPTRSYRTREPLRVIEEVHDWTRLTPEALQEWRDRIAAIVETRGEIIN